MIIIFKILKFLFLPVRWLAIGIGYVIVAIATLLVGVLIGVDEYLSTL